MGYRCFDVNVDEVDERVARVILNRPEKRNSMIPEFWDELPEIVRDIDENSRARVIVLSSTGPHFSSGLDVKSFAPGSGSQGADPEAQRRARRTRAAGFYDDVRRMQRAFSCLEGCRIPVLVAIQGGCIGGGVDLVTACDMRYATEDAFLTIFEVNIGMTADVGTFPRLVKLIPEGVVRELAYTGRRMGAREAQAVGLVNGVYPDAETMLAEVAPDRTVPYSLTTPVMMPSTPNMLLSCLICSVDGPSGAILEIFEIPRATSPGGRTYNAPLASSMLVKVSRTLSAASLVLLRFCRGSTATVCMDPKSMFGSI
jgi:enoyl-CoA hydratase